jgi:hypothetical protein
MWAEHSFSKMVHAHIGYIQQMSSWMSCMMCLVAVSDWINFKSTTGVGGPGHHVHQTWIPAYCLGVTSRNWSCCWRDRRWHVLWQLTTLWFVYSKFMRSKDLSLNVCSLEDHMQTNSMKVSFRLCIISFCTPENYKYTIHQNCCMFFFMDTLYI